MFTGIVEELGTVAGIDHGAESAVLRIEGPLVVSDARHGASIAINIGSVTKIGTATPTMAMAPAE